MLLLIALAQAAPSAPQGRIGLTVSKPCETPEASNVDVLVCGRRGEDSSRYRIPPATAYQSSRPKADLQLGNGATLSAETEQVFIGGTPSNRAMIRLKFKF